MQSVMQFLTNKRKIKEYQQFKQKTGPKVAVKKAKVGFLFTTNRAIKDVSTAKWSFIDLFDLVTIPKDLDSLYQTFAVAGRIVNVPAGDAEVKVQIFEPSGAILAEETLSGVLVAGEVTFATQFSFISVKEEGLHQIKVVLNNVLLKDDGQYSFRVVKEK